MENRVRIREAVEYAKEQGKKIDKRIVAAKVFTFRSEDSAYVCFNNYERGKSGKLNRVQVHALCKELNVDANFLFGTPPMSNQTTKENGQNDTTTKGED